MKLKCYLYSGFPGHTHWTLGVFAISRQDAREYLQAYHGGHGKPAGVRSMKQSMKHTTAAGNDMICGAVTERAQAIMSGESDQ